MAKRGKVDKVVRRVITPFEQFASNESSGGIMLIAASLIAIVWANSSLSGVYFEMREVEFGVSFGGFTLEKSLLLWVNDALMAIFFFLVGLEIKREILVGELSAPRDAGLAVVAALGGMVIPASIYLSINAGGDGAHGWGIPMATDIAFALGIMSLLGDRVPLSLKVFLTALAIVDDLGAVAVIAVFYSQGIDLGSLLVAGVILTLTFVYGRRGGRRLAVFALLGVVVWFFVLQSGVHATVAGVLLALVIPLGRKLAPENLREELRASFEQGNPGEVEVKARNLERVLEDAQSPLYRLEHSLHPWSAFLVLPVFALFNAGVTFSGGQLLGSVTAGVFFGLLLGKPIGVLLFSWIAVRLGVVSMPAGVGWGGMAGAGMLAGIGFTMSLFVSGLAFDGEMLDQAKFGIFTASVIAAVLGLLMLVRVSRKRPTNGRGDNLRHS